MTIKVVYSGRGDIQRGHVADFEELPYLQKPSLTLLLLFRHTDEKKKSRCTDPAEAPSPAERELSYGPDATLRQPPHCLGSS